MKRILVIQTAFIGDVVLATGLLEKIHTHLPSATIDILVRKGNESLFRAHPFLGQVWVWDKKKSKYGSLFRIWKEVRRMHYDLVVNVQRYAATGLLTALSGARHTVGFDKNPFSFLFSEVIRHEFSEGVSTVHEVDRNHHLIASFTDAKAAKPVLYPSPADHQAAKPYTSKPFVCFAPASVWFTKQFPANQWIALLDALPQHLAVYLLGAPGDQSLCENIRSGTAHSEVHNLAGKLDYLGSAALMQQASMNFVNDSAPMHFASAVNAPVTAIYCSTIPAFGYGPLSDNRHIVELLQPLGCRPCGLHGRASCPLNHFNCARQITTAQLLDCLPS